jgi:hypothetical protein
LTGHGGRLETAVAGLGSLGIVFGLEYSAPLEVTSHPAHGVLEHGDNLLQLTPMRVAQHNAKTLRPIFINATLIKEE